MVQGHGQQDVQFYAIKCVDEPHLKQASIKINLWYMKPEDSKRLEHNVGTNSNICDS